MAKKTKIEAANIHSREGMMSAVADVVGAKLRVAELTAQMEQEVNDVQRRYQEGIEALGREIAAKEQGVYVWAQRNPGEFPPERRTIDLPTATVGWRLSPPSVEKVRAKDKWEDIAYRLVEVVEDGFIGENYVRYAEPSVDKKQILADANIIPTAALKLAGLAIEQEDVFSIRPKSELAEAGPAEARRAA
jgi:phage host-nuclease inhibitor protein Gam